MVRSVPIALLAFVILSCDKGRPPPAAPPPGAADVVGQVRDGGVVVPTQQLIRPAGESVEFFGRPVDLAVSPDGGTVYVKERQALVVLDAATWRVRQTLAYGPGEGATMYGMAVSRDGGTVYVTTTGQGLREAKVAGDGALAWGRVIPLPGRDAKTPSYPCGVAIGGDGRRAYVCLSMSNTLGVVDLEKGALEAEVPVSVAPYNVTLSPDGAVAYVSNWGGRRPVKGDKTAKTAGTDAVVDHRGVGASGTVSVVDLAARKVVSEIPVGLHPADMKLAADGRRLYVANANSDTVSVIDTGARTVVETIPVRPDPTLPFGSASNALALSADGQWLFVANGGNNAVAVVKLNGDGRSVVEGFIPAGWYPGAVAVAGDRLVVANVKGLGSRKPGPDQKGWAVHQHLGTVQKVAVPGADALAGYTKRVLADSRVPQALAAWERATSGVRPRPVPARLGEPSVFEHVVYVIKENRTYDQVFGGIGKGRSEPSLCVFGRDVTPNHHALAEQFVLLDNFYCNGVLSADGHAWSTQGTTVDYLEKSFGGWVRSYPFGDDPLAVASSGFLWDNALLHGRSFRNYGELAYAKLTPADATWADVYADHVHGTRKVASLNETGPALLERYSCPDYPGWNLKVPDGLRMNVFLKEFEEAKRKGEWPNLVIVYLPNDHTNGVAEGSPTPAAMVADNDLALGRLIEAISHSPFWPRTCVFVTEDDPQDGFDHVDGHRSLCLVVSPYTKRGQVVSQFYNQTTVLHTMQRMLGLPPMNQHDAMAPLMHECFTEKPDPTPYMALPNRVPLDQMNPGKAALRGAALELARESERIDFSLPDRADEDTLNRIVWHAVKGVEARYPAKFAGAHGKGLNGLKLKPTDEDEDDE